MDIRILQTCFVVNGKHRAGEIISVVDSIAVKLIQRGFAVPLHEDRSVGLNDSTTVAEVTKRKGRVDRGSRVS